MTELTSDLEDIFLREGFLHLRTIDLARRLRCSKRTLYELARTRDELFVVVIEGWLERIRREGDLAAERAKNPFEAVAGFLNAAPIVTRQASHRFMRDLARFPPGRERLRVHQRIRIAGLEQLVENGVSAGTFRGVHPKLVAETMLVAVARLIDPDVLTDLDMTVAEAFEEFYRIFDYGLLSPDERERRSRRRRTSRARDSAT